MSIPTKDGAVIPSGTVLNVGATEQYTTIASAVAAASAGDVLQIDAGGYVDDFFTIDKPLVLEGVGGTVYLLASGQGTLVNGAAIDVEANATIANFDISNIYPDSNNTTAAAVVQGKGALTFVNTRIHGNAMGIVTTPNLDPNSTLALFDSELLNNGDTSAPGTSNANISVGALANLYLDNSYVHDALGGGSQIISSAANNAIINSVVASYNNAGDTLAVFTGGDVNVTGSTFEQNPMDTSNNMIMYTQTDPNVNLNFDNTVFSSAKGVSASGAVATAVMVNGTVPATFVNSTQAYQVNLGNTASTDGSTVLSNAVLGFSEPSPVSTQSAFAVQTPTSSGVTVNPPPAAPTLIPDTTPAPIPSQPPAETPIYTVGPQAYRFFDSVHGTQFLTNSQDEMNQIKATRPDLTFEGAAFTTASQSDPGASAVYRFFDSVYGTHFYTSSANEMQTVQATRADLKYEGVGFYEHAAQGAGDTAIYRFFDSNNGTHFYTSSQLEQQTVLSTRPDLVPEGVAFYTPQQTSV